MACVRGNEQLHLFRQHPSQKSFLMLGTNKPAAAPSSCAPAPGTAVGRNCLQQLHDLHCARAMRASSAPVVQASRA